uniref:Uncharacterized protein n=1 Tax=Rhizophora mucronata TaxID=61149 RepID=A0A2P2MIX4_RHIMU
MDLVFFCLYFLIFC